VIRNGHDTGETGGGRRLPTDHPNRRRLTSEALTAAVAALALFGCCGAPVLVAALGAVAAGAVFGGAIVAVAVFVGGVPLVRRWASWRRQRRCCNQGQAAVRRGVVCSRRRDGEARP